MAVMHWDIFCRVIDNFGDVGVSWRLCSALASRGHAVRLWIDDPAPLAFEVPADVRDHLLTLARRALAPLPDAAEQTA
mgnify:CR=1 FL=1